MVRLLYDNFESALLSIELHFLNHSRHGLEDFCRIQLLDAAPWEHFNFGIKSAYNRTFTGEQL